MSKRKYDVYIEKADGFGWYVSSDQTYCLEFCSTKWGAQMAADKWDAKLNSPKKRERYYVKDSRKKVEE